MKIPFSITWFLLLCAILMIPAGACQKRFKPSLQLPQNQAIMAKDYRAILDLWTKEDIVYSGFEHKMTAHATMITPMLRRAFAQRFPEIYGYGGQLTRKELVELSQSSEETLNFFVAIYTPQDKWNDLDKKDSIWHLTLQKIPHLKATEQEVITSVDAYAIERLRIDENIKNVYDYVGLFDQAYIVRFPLTDDNNDNPMISTHHHQYLRLRIASSLGAATMTWELIP